MFTRTILASATAGVMLISASISALAWPGALDGRPTITPDSPTGYYIWHEDGFHIRTHGPGLRHDFVGRLTTDGVFQNVDTVRLESRDDVVVADGGHTLIMKFHTYDYEDGVNFTIAGGDKLRFSLELDGRLVSPERIFLGAAGAHPPSNPFTIHR